MSLSDETREQIRIDAETERTRTYCEDWHCLRCLHEFETNDRELYDTWDQLVDKPCCPTCGWDSAVEQGELPNSRDDLPACCGCETPYTLEAVRLGDWDTSDMESPVCRPCVNAWAKRGAGYYQCSGCGKRILTAQKITWPQHLRRVLHNGTKTARARIDWKPCGQWQREENGLSPRGVVALKSGGGSPPT